MRPPSISVRCPGAPLKTAVLSPTLSQANPSTCSPIIRPSTRRAGSRVDVYETLTLLQFPDACPAEDVLDAVDRVWSLQYMVSGPVCGSAGRLLPLPGAEPRAPPFTHAVLFRYGRRATADAFLDNPRTQELLGQVATGVAEGAVCLRYAVCLMF